MESTKSGTMVLFTVTENTVTDKKTNLWSPGGKAGGGINWDMGLIYTHYSI